MAKKAWGPSNPLWRWQHKKGRKRSSKRRSHAKTRSVRHTARRRGRRGRRGGTKIPVITLAILAGQIGTAYYGTGTTIGGSRALSTLNSFQSFYTGIDFSDRQFHGERLLMGYGPWVAKRFLGAIARPRISMRGLPISLS